MTWMFCSTMMSPETVLRRASLRMPETSALALTTPLWLTVKWKDADGKPGLLLVAHGTVDALDDLKLAVDEACALAIAAAPADTDLTVTLRVTGQTVEVELLSVSSTGTPIRTNTFAWTVLTALVDTVETRVSEDGLLSIRLGAHGIESVAS